MISFYIIGIVLSIAFNLVVVIVLLTKRSQVNHLDLLMLSLAASDILQAAVGYPVEIDSLLNTKVISQSACRTAGFTITFLALVSISHLAGISIERCILLSFPWKAREWFSNRWVSLYIIIPSWIYGLMWAIFPLLGWSSYKREQGATHRCSIDLESRHNNATSYAYSILVFCFVIPILCIVISSVLILKEMKRMTTQVAALGISGLHANLRRKREMKHTVMAFVLIATFLITWSPYAACVFAMASRDKVEDTLLTFSAILAKTSTLYNPIIYFIFMKEFRQRCLLMVKCHLMRGPVHNSSTRPVVQVNSANSPNGEGT